MNEAKKTGEKPNLRTIEELAEMEKVPAPVLAGTAAAEGWQRGKMVLPADFRRAVKRFAGQSADGRSVK